MRRPDLGIIVCVCLALVIWCGAARATLIEYRSPQQLGSQADLVVRGRVLGGESYLNSKGTKIYTRTRIAVDEAYKGAAPAVLEVVQLGGVVGGIKVTVHGAPHWRAGDEVLLFVEARDAGTYRVLGLAQGKFMIERHPVTGEMLVRAPRMDGSGLSGGRPEHKDRQTVSAVPLDEFVRHALDGSAGEGVTR